MSRGIRLLAAIVVLLVSPTVVFASPPDFSAVDAAARDAVASGEIPGVVVFVGRGNDVLYHRAFGWRALVPDAETMTPETVFDIASLTKPLGTTIAIMALIERGAVKLDAPVGRYLKEFRGKEFDKITIQRLLTHSAGFPGYPPNAVVQGGFPGATRALAKLPLDYPPGTGFQYSDTGFMLLGEVVRRVVGEPLDLYLDRILFRPLGLRETTFKPNTVMRARTAPTEYWQGRMLRGEVHDPRARLLGGVAGHAGMFSTASDVARICRLLLSGGSVSGKSVLRPATIALMWSRSSDGSGRRALGWDMSSGYSLIHAPFFPAGSVGHTGFTGTSVWLDPATRSYMILLTNRVHPNGGNASRIRELRVRVAAAVGAALFAQPAPPGVLPEATVGVPSGTTTGTQPATTAGAQPATTTEAQPETTAKPPEGTGDTPAPTIDAPSTPPAERVRSGLDVLVEQNFSPLKGHAVGLVTNQTGVDANGRRAIDLIAAAPDVKLQAIFSPEHGITGTSETDVAHGRDAPTGRPIWSLYGRARRPDASMMDGVTAFVFDIQDVGARYYTYLTTLVYVMEEAARRNIPVFVLDRPNPITGQVVEGPLMDADLESFTAPHTIPVRTGMTIGEFARMAAAERKIPAALTVVPLAGWNRAKWFDQTGLPWVNPSPNIRSVTQALLYSGVGLLESTNLSVGRGTDMPFEVIGAPWIDPHALVAALESRNLPGVRFEPAWFTPTADKYARIACAGVRFIVTDRDALRPVTMALALAVALRDRHRDQWRAEMIQNLLVNRATIWAFLSGEPFERLLAWSDADRTNFLNRRASYLIY